MKQTDYRQFGGTRSRNDLPISLCTECYHRLDEVKKAFAAGQKIEFRGKAVAGFWHDWQHATNPQWHDSMDTEYRVALDQGVNGAEWRDIGDGRPVRIQKCSLCGVAPSCVDDCGAFGNASCPYFGVDKAKAYDKRILTADGHTSGFIVCNTFCNSTLDVFLALASEARKDFCLDDDAIHCFIVTKSAENYLHTGIRFSLPPDIELPPGYTSQPIDFEFTIA